MGMAEKQNLPKREEVTQTWTFKRLFQLNATVSAVTKIFNNPFDVLLVFLIIIASVGELIGDKVSWPFWVFSALMLYASFEEHQRIRLEEPNPKSKK